MRIEIVCLREEEKSRCGVPISALYIDSNKNNNNTISIKNNNNYDQILKYIHARSLAHTSHHIISNQFLLFSFICSLVINQIKCHVIVNGTCNAKSMLETLAHRHQSTKLRMHSVSMVHWEMFGLHGIRPVSHLLNSKTDVMLKMRFEV